MLCSPFICVPFEDNIITILGDFGSPNLLILKGDKMGWASGGAGGGHEWVPLSPFPLPTGAESVLPHPGSGLLANTDPRFLA